MGLRFRVGLHNVASEISGSGISGWIDWWFGWLGCWNLRGWCVWLMGFGLELVWVLVVCGGWAVLALAFVELVDCLGFGLDWL